MNDDTKITILKIAMYVVAVILVPATVCNTVFPILKGQPFYAFFNIVACGACWWFVVNKIKKLGGFA